MRPQASCIDRFWSRTLPLAGVLGVLFALLSALALAPRSPIARAATPSVTLVSPANASGPVQTGIRIAGANWDAGASVQLFYYATNAANAPCGDPANSQTLAGSQPIPPGSPITVQPDGSWFLDFQWPSTTGTGQFYICAFETTTPTQVTASNQPFNVLSTNLPGIVSITPPLPNIGDQITIQGSGFLPGNQPLDLKLVNPTNTNQQVSLGTTTSDGSGNFTQMVTLPTTISGNLQIVASSRPSVSGALPPLIAIANVTVNPTASTATPGATSTTTVTPQPTAAVPTTTTNNGGGSPPSTSSLILYVLLVLLAVVLLAIFGILVWYFAGIRPPAGVGAPGLAPAPARSRVTGAPYRAPGGMPSQPEWPSDEWEGQQAPWEEDDRGSWGSATQGDDGTDEWNPPGRGHPSGPGAPPGPRRPGRPG